MVGAVIAFVIGFVLLRLVSRDWDPVEDWEDVDSEW